MKGKKIQILQKLLQKMKGENTLQIIFEVSSSLILKPKNKKRNQRKTKKEKITYRLILLMNMDIKPLNKILALIQQYIKMIIFYCCSIAKSCPTLCNPMDCNMPDLPVPNHFSEFAQVHVHWIGGAVQPSHPLSLSSPSAPQSFQSNARSF